MNKEITPCPKTEISAFSKLQEYDYAEFNSQKNQAIKAHFISQKFQFMRFKSARYETVSYTHLTLPTT